MSQASLDFFHKHEFLIRRLHSLSGLVPVGAYMTVHLIVNASLLNGANTFQTNVNNIHALGSILPLVEWSFIFLPIIFHAGVGIWIIRTGKSNHDHYRYVANWRYTLQRWTGVIAVVFIFAHVFHLHGWFHADWWLEKIATPLGGAQFRPYNAASTLGAALSGFAWPIFYFIGIVACVFHLANGVWTMGITWGVWISPNAQRNASYVCAGGGTLLLMAGLSSLYAAKTVDQAAAKEIEDKMYETKVDSGELTPAPHKRTGGHHGSENEEHIDHEDDSDKDDPTEKLPRKADTETEPSMKGAEADSAKAPPTSTDVSIQRNGEDVEDQSAESSKQETVGEPG